jgi:transcriptional regulator with XRE-family HTH domain
LNVDDTMGRKLARNIRRRRIELGMTQQRLAAEMTAAGCAGWTSSTVANTERQDKPRALSVEELGGLCAALRCDIYALLKDMPETAARIRGRGYPRRGGRSYGPQVPAGPRGTWALEAAAAERQERLDLLVYRLAKSLGVQEWEVGEAAGERYGRDVLAERDARLAGEPPGDPRDRSKRLGHATRAIRAELADYLDDQRLPEPGDTTG